MPGGDRGDRGTPSHCACGTVFSVDHALSSPKGGLPSLRHNEIRDLTACLLTEVCHEVQVDPVLQLVSNPGSFVLSKANTQARRCSFGFWGVGQNAVLWMLESSILLLPPM